LRGPNIRIYDVLRATTDIIADNAAAAGMIIGGRTIRPMDLEPGQIVLAGSFTRPVPVAAGDVIHADYGPLGAIGVSFV
jgi:2-keto-4-pentenoate hydratase